MWQPLWRCGVTPTDPCAHPGMNQHRLVERPVLNSLLGHLPGSVPYATHLEIEGARARMVHRALGEALGQLGNPHADYGRQAAALKPTAPLALKLPPVRPAPQAARIDARVVYTLPRRKWPLGGLIDLVI